MSKETDAWYDAESVNRFVRATLRAEKPQPVADEDLKAAAWALLAAMQGRDIRNDMGIGKQRGERGPKLDTSKVTVDHPAMDVVLRWRSGGLKYKDALEEFINVTGLAEVTAKKCMKELRPRAEESIKAFDLMYAMATDTAPPKRKF